MARRPPIRDPQWQLTHAAKNGDLGMLRTAMLGGADVNFDKGAALVHAASAGHVAVIRALLDEYGADLHLDDDLALRRAVAMKHVLAARLLLQRGANPNANGGQALISAATWNLSGTVDLLLEKGADIHVQGDLPLLRACYYNGRETLALLLSRGADVMAAAKLVDDGKTENRQLIAASVSAERRFFDGAFAGAADPCAFLAAEAVNLRWFPMREPNFIRAAHMGRLGDAVAVYGAAGAFTEETLSGMTDRQGRPLLDYLMRDGLLPSVFVLRHWGGNIAAMTRAWKACWSRMAPQQQKDHAHIAADIERQVGDHRRDVLRRRAPKYPPSF